MNTTTNTTTAGVSCMMPAMTSFSRSRSMAHGNLYRSPPLLGITAATETTNEHSIFAHLQSKIDPKRTKHACVASSLGCFWISGPNPNTISHTAPAATLEESKTKQGRIRRRWIFSKRRDQK